MAFVIDPKPQKEAVKEAICRSGCGAKLGYVANDIKADYDSDYTGSKDYYNYVDCPQCHSQVRIS